MSHTLAHPGYTTRSNANRQVFGHDSLVMAPVNALITKGRRISFNFARSFSWCIRDFTLSPFPQIEEKTDVKANKNEGGNRSPHSL